MFALVTSSALKSASDLEFLRELRSTEAHRIARQIANLHRVLVSPNVAPVVAAAAKRMLLGVLERTRGMRLPFMIAPPITEPPAARRSTPFDSISEKGARKLIAKLPRQNSSNPKAARIFAGIRHEPVGLAR